MDPIEITPNSIRDVSNYITRGWNTETVDQATYDAHVPAFVGKEAFVNPDLFDSFATNIKWGKGRTNESVLAVSRAIRGKGPRVSEEVYKAHVPEVVSKQGLVHPEMVGLPPYKGAPFNGRPISKSDVASLQDFFEAYSGKTTVPAKKLQELTAATKNMLNTKGLIKGNVYNQLSESDKKVLAPLAKNYAAILAQQIQ